MEGCVEAVARLQEPVGQCLHPGLRGWEPQLVPDPPGHGGPDPHPQHLLQAPGRQQGRHLRHDGQLGRPRLGLCQPHGHQPPAAGLGQESGEVTQPG